MLSCRPLPPVQAGVEARGGACLAGLREHRSRLVTGLASKQAEHEVLAPTDGRGARRRELLDRTLSDRRHQPRPVVKARDQTSGFKYADRDGDCRSLRRNDLAKETVRER
jgi:hypothetical protein